jgi:hypothetical protein
MKNKTTPINGHSKHLPATLTSGPNGEVIPAFKNMVDLLSVFTEASNRLAELEAETNKQLIELLDDVREEYAKNQEALTKAETAMEAIALANKDWFKTKKSIKTPFGTVSFKSSTSLEVPNEEASLVRIQLAAEKLFPGDEETAQAARAEYISRFVRTKATLNLEALEKLVDADLKAIGIKRVHSENFSAKPAVIDLGKAVKEQVEAPTTTNTNS